GHHRASRGRRRHRRRHRAADLSRLPLPRRLRGRNRDAARDARLVPIGDRRLCAGGSELGRVAHGARRPPPARAEAATAWVGRMSGAVFVERAPLAGLGKALLAAAGATPDHAGAVVDHLVEADTMGLKSHGVLRVPQYLEDIAAGGIDPVAAPVFVRGAPGRAACDGNRGFGQVVGQAMAREAVRLADAAGVAFVTGRHMGHTGRIGAYPEAIAAAGMIGIAVCSGPRSGHWVAPFGGREGRLATNPIAYALPVAGAPPVVADFSTSVVPEGVVRNLKYRG